MGSKASAFYESNSKAYAEEFAFDFQQTPPKDDKIS
jgi:hypothetical protein